MPPCHSNPDKRLAQHCLVSHLSRPARPRACKHTLHKKTTHNAQIRSRVFWWIKCSGYSIKYMCTWKLICAACIRTSRARESTTSDLADAHYTSWNENVTTYGMMRFTPTRHHASPPPGTPAIILPRSFEATLNLSLTEANLAHQYNIN